MEIVKPKRKFIEDFALMDDLFFRFVVDGNIPLIELMLSIIIDKKVKVLNMAPQKDEANLRGRSVIFDVFVKDENGTLYNIEVQHGSSGAHRKRARYNSSMLDYNHIKKGEKGFSSLPETFVIMICDNDVLDGEKAIYHIDRYVKEMEMDFNDEAHIIYINSSYQEENDKTDLAYLIHDMMCTDYEKMHYNEIKECVRRAKNPKGVIYKQMSKVLEEQYQYGVVIGEEKGLKLGEEKGFKLGEKKGLQLGEEKGLKLGRDEMAKEVAIRLLERKQYSYDEIAEISGYPKDSVYLLAKETECSYGVKK